MLTMFFASRVPPIAHRIDDEIVHAAIHGFGRWVALWSFCDRGDADLSMTPRPQLVVYIGKVTDHVGFRACRNHFDGYQDHAVPDDEIILKVDVEVIPNLVSMNLARRRGVVASCTKIP